MSEAKKIGNLDVMKRMADENKSIMLCPDVLKMKYSKKSDGTRVEVGVPGNVIASIFNGEKMAVLLMWDVKQFNELKALMESESQP